MSSDVCSHLSLDFDRASPTPVLPALELGFFLGVDAVSLVPVRRARMFLLSGRALGLDRASRRPERRMNAAEAEMAHQFRSTISSCSPVSLCPSHTHIHTQLCYTAVHSLTPLGTYNVLRISGCDSATPLKRGTYLTVSLSYSAQQEHMLRVSCS